MKFGNVRVVDTAMVPEFDQSAVNFLWFNDFYDGPRAGMAEVNGTQCYFVKIDPNAIGEDEEDERYWLIALTTEQIEEEVHWHQLFCDNVGSHFDQSGYAPVSPESMNMDVFYAQYRDRVLPDYANNNVVGWFRR